MTKINWELIFIANKKEICNYVNNCDLRELSILCKLVRSKLKSILFESIFINDKIEEIIKEGFIRSKTALSSSTFGIPDLPAEDYIKQFSSSIKLLLPYIKRVNIENYGSDYHLMALTGLLPQITSISVYNTSLRLSSFQIVLNSIQNLEILSVKYISFDKSYKESNSITSIKLPNNLKLIEWKYCLISISSFEEDPEFINYDYNEDLLDRRLIGFQIDYFPNLKKFSGYNLPATFNTEFLSTNQQLKWVDIKISSLNAVEILESITNIKKLEIMVVYLNIDLSVINLNLVNLTSLHFTIENFETWLLLRKLTLSSPNLIELKIQFEISVSPPVIQLINQIPNLKKLIIKSSYKLKIILNNFNPHQNLEYFEAWTSLDINSALETLASYPNLKVVCFGKEAIHSLYLLSLSLQKTPYPWKSIDSREFLKYHRLIE